ncbi:alpha-hydroxy acid oxidase [Actibacterium lipolyticum]|uniref:L-lactate dehydrogenase [cytochrome] n=1 Tax=Actibacterium lipolyticum TaxID=1524263 RepID=A0A238KLQ6_9RHOB|nr:alpha-hydroxy acid oxidase [Actibacterium lipolyticum]SMX43693.1 L-lactate dehydrogenase [cytochrome] [Actibacterium lipolyticum]
MSELPGTLAEYAQRASEVLSPDTAAYFLGGAGAEVTLAQNRCDLDRVSILPQHLRDLRGGTTSLDLIGQRMAHPIIAAPMAFQTLLHPDGECATAAAVTAQQGHMALSAQASQPMADVIASGPGCVWFQMYWHGNRETTLALAHRAAAAGFKALILTVDAPVNGVRDGEIAAGFSPPEGLGAVNLNGLPHPQFAPLHEGESAIFDRIAHVLPRWDDVAWLCDQSPLPIILKGILTPSDALRGVEAGAAGIIVSNHGGRVLDGAVSSIAALPGVVAAVDGAVPVLMDGGIRRGVDVFRALALGAQAVLVGRPIAHGLAVGGAHGVSHVLRLLRDELEITMALAGCATLADITADRVTHPFGAA